MTLTLEGLPTEVLTIICKFLDDRTENEEFRTSHKFRSIEEASCRRDLLNVARCSSHLKNVIEPILYTTFVQANAAQLVKFLRTILHRPVLGTFVKRVNIRVNTQIYNHRRELIPPMKLMLNLADSRNMRRAMTSLGSLTEPIAISWITKLQAGNADAVAAILLLLMPRLKDLTLIAHDSPAETWEAAQGADDAQIRTPSTMLVPGYPCVSRVLDELSSSQSQLLLTPGKQQLRKLAFVGPNNGPETMDESRLSTMCDFPSLLKLSVRIPVMIPTTQSYTFNIKALHIFYTRLTQEEIPALRKFVASFPKLEEFWLESEPYLSSNEGWYACTINHFLHALSDAKSPLKDLRIHQVEFSSTRLRLDRTATFQSLACFPNLENVDILASENWMQPSNPGHPQDDGLIFPLFELAFLPPRIKRLTLRQCSGQTLKQILNVLEAKSAKLPALEYVHVILDSGFDEVLDKVSEYNLSEFRQILVRFGSGCGVEVVIERGGDFALFDGTIW